MPRTLRCSQGHQWTVSDEAEATTLDESPTCPQCGAASRDDGPSSATASGTALLPGSPPSSITWAESTEDLSTASFEALSKATPLPSTASFQDPGSGSTVSLSTSSFDPNSDRTAEFSTAPFSRHDSEGTVSLGGTSEPLVNQLDRTQEQSTSSIEPASDQTAELSTISFRGPGDDKTVDLSSPSFEVGPLDRTAVDPTVPMEAGSESDQTAFEPTRLDQTLDEAQGHGVKVSDKTHEWTSSGSNVDVDDLTEKEKKTRQVTPGEIPEASSMKFSVKKPAPPAQATVEGYEIISELGRGAMGVVYKARQKSLNRLVALKMVLAGQHASQKDLIRFQIEAEAVARLHHRNIVQIYQIGEQEGRPWFSLEYVEGGTLSDRLAHKPLNPAIAANLVMQLAQAMDSAHRAGIVHRDLKPGNILLGQPDAEKVETHHAPAESDELETILARSIPKISDFGLAKRLKEDSGQTRAGSILGTPSYMAPEQAEGKAHEVGPPADIYALGAILYDLLTGRPPFRGATLLETLEQVKVREPVPPSRITQRLPRDLETICLKCLQKEVPKRYISASDLAEDLRRFQAGEPILARPVAAWERAWKWTKRRPGLAGLTALSTALVLALILGGIFYAHSEHTRAATEAGLRQKAEEERLIAEHQRLLADTNFRHAQDAVDVMLTRVGQERLQDEPRMEKVRRDLLVSALSFYERFLKQKTDDPGVRLQTARAFRKVGDIQGLLGDTAQALKAYRSSLAMADDLAKEFSDDHTYHVEKADASNNLAVALSRSNQKEESLSVYEEALTEQRLIRTREPDNAAYAKAYADTLYNLGITVDAVKKPGSGMPYFDEAQAIEEKLIASHDQEVIYQSDLAKTLAAKGIQLLSLGQRPESDVCFKKSLEIREKLAKANKSGTQYREDLARGHNDRAVALQTNGQIALSLADYQKAAEVFLQLSQDFPSIPMFGQERARTLVNRATLQMQTNPGEAITSLTQARDQWDKLKAQFGNRPSFDYEHARTQFVMATALLLEKKANESEKLFLQAIDEFKNLSAPFPSNPDYSFGEVGCLNNLGDLYRMANQPEKALKTWHEAEAVAANLAREFSQQPLYAREQAKSLINQGVVLNTLGRYEEAESADRKALEIYDKLVRQFKAEAAYKIDLAKGNGELAIVLAGRGQLLNSEKAFRQAIQILQELEKELPNLREPWEEEIVLQDNLTKLYKAQGKANEMQECTNRIAQLKNRLASSKN